MNFWPFCHFIYRDSKKKKKNIGNGAVKGEQNWEMTQARLKLASPPA